MTTLLKKASRTMKSIYSIDKRSMALFRLFYGIMIIFDLIDRAQFLEAHYTNEGLVDLKDLLRDRIIVHRIYPSYYFQLGLFILHGLFALCFAIGYKTKLMTVINWIFWQSLMGHAPIINSGGDVIVRLVFYWSIFLPLGDVWSIDSLLSKDTNAHAKDYKFFNFGTVGMICQFQVMYFFSTFHKTHAAWLEDYSATFLALNIAYFQTPLAKLMVKWAPRWTLQVMTYFVLKWELWGPSFYIFPIFSEPLRLIGTLGFLLMHLGFGLCMHLGIFFWGTFLGNLIFFPGLFWDIILGKLKSESRCKSVVIFETGSLFSDILKSSNFFFLQYTPTTTKKGQPEDQFEQDISSDDSEHSFIRVVTHKQEHLFNLDAIIFLLKEIIPFTFVIGYLLEAFPANLSKSINHVGLKLHRMSAYSPNEIKRQNLKQEIRKISKKRSSWIPKPNTLWSVFVALLTLYSLSVILSDQLKSIKYTKTDLLPYSYRVYAYRFNLLQSWRMFSPKPAEISMHPVITGSLVNNQTVDLFSNKAIVDGHWKAELIDPNFDPIAGNLSALIGSHRWFKVFELGFKENKQTNFHRLMGRFVCKQFNSKNKNKLKSFDMVYYYSKLDHATLEREVTLVNQKLSYDCLNDAFIFPK